MAPLSFRRERDKTPQLDLASPSPSTPAGSSSSGAEVPGSPSRPSISSPRSFRFLRRKASMSAKSSDAESPGWMPNTASTTTSTFGDALENLPEGLGYRQPRRGSEPELGEGGGGREGGVVVIDAGAELGRPARMAAEHPFMAHVGGSTLGRPATPPSASSYDSNHPPVYPTALSPPRRPMPKSKSSETSTTLSLDSPLMTGYSPRPPTSASRLNRRPSRTESPRKLVSAAPITPTRHRQRDVSNSSADTSTSTESEDGDIGIVSSKRRSLRDGTGQYEVEVVCNDSRAEDEEMRWEVVIRKRRPNAEPINPPTSPLALSTSSSIAPAPMTASSINLSLSLDQPTGKLVFIAFPMDLHATPRRTARAPTTPPRAVTPPPAPNPNASPSTPPPPGHRKRISESSMWPSPSRAGRRSPSAPSPRNSDLWTPRRTRMVSASELNGGLYARGTVDGMSEQLEELGGRRARGTDGQMAQ
ncbi:hypothetical protein DB88DRAFT_471091 [Papiliotrema laurentii]|uniref:Uncharacterized protein n=1 Tax=Papiliotrema laurentii TaxID=5418 RepID=A0AAD9L8Q9_PAPLA|nr:hypothetical protein DB88DRAFT_471091 [Papiliotrema laurentii]